MDLYDVEQHFALASEFGIDFQCFNLSYAGAILWLLGYPDQAQARSVEALALARELAHPYSLAYALSAAATFHAWRGEVPSAESQSEAANTLSSERGFTLTLGWGQVVHGWALAAQGHHERGIDLVCKGLDVYRASGTQEWMAHYLAMLAESHAMVGQSDQALAALVEALGICDGEMELWYEAEIHRLKGELALQAAAKRLDPGAQPEAEASFRKALEIAREQSAKSWELRAATSLARLWQQQGKQAEAHHLLSEIYNWFSEGFDTKDLQEAKSLLEELG